MLRKLAQIATELDKRGFYSEANMIDRLIKKLAAGMPNDRVNKVVQMIDNLRVEDNDRRCVELANQLESALNNGDYSIIPDLMMDASEAIQQARANPFRDSDTNDRVISDRDFNEIAAESSAGARLEYRLDTSHGIRLLGKNTLDPKWRILFVVDDVPSDLEAFFNEIEYRYRIDRDMTGYDELRDLTVKLYQDMGGNGKNQIHYNSEASFDPSGFFPAEGELGDEVWYETDDDDTDDLDFSV
jgi:hypothetical protein